jgi:hypothetical protein
MSDSPYALLRRCRDVLSLFEGFQECVELVDEIDALMAGRQQTTKEIYDAAWSGRAPAGWTPGQKIPVRPADQPDRKECVIAFAPDGIEIEWRRWEIKRDWDERIIALEEQSFDTPPKTEAILDYMWAQKISLIPRGPKLAGFIIK